MAEFIKEVVIVGGDSCASSVAAYIANSLRGTDARITLIDDLACSTRAASTVPVSTHFYKSIRFKEDSLVASTGATFKLGTEHSGWTNGGQRFTLTYGEHGTPIRLLPFHQYFIRRKLSGDKGSYDDFSLPAAAIQNSRFDFPTPSQNVQEPSFDYAIHVDPAAFAKAMLQYAVAAGVKHVNGTAVDATVRSGSNLVDSVTLGNGEKIAGDFFIDCSGARSLIIGDTLNVGYESWAGFLPCDRLLCATVRDTYDTAAVTRVAAQKNGWLRRIQMMDRAEFQYFYNGDTSSAEVAARGFSGALGGDSSNVQDGGTLEAGQRKTVWQGNCVAIGNSASNMEPLENSALSRAHRATMRLMALWPHKNGNTAIAAEYDRLTKRDNAFALNFAMLFYALSDRTDSDFWRHCQTLDQSQSLRRYLELFRSRGRLNWDAEDCVSRDRWLSALIGLDCMPENCDPLADIVNDELIDQYMGQIRQVVEERMEQMPGHKEVLQRYYKQA